MVSAFEYQVAKAVLPGDRIIFNGPIKHEEDLRAALGADKVNLDSFRKIHFLPQMAAEFGRVEVSLRICFDFPGLASRFGFEVEGGSWTRPSWRWRQFPPSRWWRCTAMLPAAS